MKKLNKYYVLISLFILFSCVSTKNPADYLVEDNLFEIEFSKQEETDEAIYQILFLSDDKMIAKRVYSNGKLLKSEGIIPDGQGIERYEDGKIKNIIRYRNQLRNGKGLSFHKNGKLKSESNYLNDNPDGITRYYYENGSKKVELKIENNKTIYYREYDKEGHLTKEDKSSKEVSVPDLEQ